MPTNTQKKQANFSKKKRPGSRWPEITQRTDNLTDSHCGKEINETHAANPIEPKRQGKVKT